MDTKILCFTRPSLISPSNCRRISGVGSNGSSSNGGDNNDNSKNGTNPPGSFITGRDWSIDSQPKSALKLPIESPLTGAAHAKAPSGMLWETLKEELEDKENSQANIQMNIKKLDAISKVTKRKQAYSPYLWISQLPSTVMPDDIKRMEVTEGSIIDVIYHRNRYLEFLNRVTVVFRSATDAVEFLTQKYGKFLGGHKLTLSMLDPYHPKDKQYIPPQLKPEPMAGQLVLVSGLPATSRPDHLRTEFRRFQLMDTTEAAIIPVPSRKTSSSSQYLIRLSSRSEAYRFIRTYHNTYFQFKEFRKRCPIRATIIY
ncbi:hypothetical protein BGZ76_001343 [Entomortierella beljakovae]|nr:hypothetical protein BGZ76_001343 [Entomortierella beljakovae]